MDDGSADFAKGLAEVGITLRTAASASLVLWIVSAAVIAVFYSLDSAKVGRAFLYTAFLCLALAAISVWSVLRLERYSRRTQEVISHIRISGGVVTILYGTITLGDARWAFSLYGLAVLPIVCFVFPWRTALPYPIAATGITVVCGLLTPAPALGATVLVTTGVMVLVSAALLVTNKRARVLATRNRGLAYTDALTGVANVRALRQRITAELGRGKEKGAPFALFAMDLDEFKRVNDTFDHTVGDAVLRAVARALHEELAPGDMVARRGGDEFSVVVTNAGTRDLDDLTSRIEAAIIRAREATCPEITPTGSAAYIRTQPGEELGSMMARADDALHQAKLASRRRRLDQAARVDAAVGTRRPGHDSLKGDAQQRIDGPERTAQPAQASAGRAQTLFKAARRGAPEWQFAGLLFAVGGAMIAFLSVSGLVRPLGTAEGLSIAGAELGLSLGCFYAAGTGVSRKWLHLPWVIAYALI
ncbi:MAG: GGDEF domain-containing protein, partial [Solirubrobacteraceae bacterium]